MLTFINTQNKKKEAIAKAPMLNGPPFYVMNNVK